MSKKTEQAMHHRKGRRTHGATCGICAKPKRYKKDTIQKETKGDTA